MVIGLGKRSEETTKIPEGNTVYVAIFTSQFWNNSREWVIRPKAFGGGNPSYTGYTVPNKMLRDDNGSYAVSGSILSTQIAFSGTSVLNSAWVATMTVDDSGKAFVSYLGW